MELQFWRGTRKRGTWPRMNGRMMAVLHALIEVTRQDAEVVFAPVEADLRTLHALMRHDWIVEADTPAGRQYTITGRGRKAYEIYVTPRYYRDDGLCPSCVQAPVYQTETTRYDYCLPCYRARQRDHKARAKRERLARRLQISMGSPL